MEAPSEKPAPVDRIHELVGRAMDLRAPRWAGLVGILLFMVFASKDRFVGSIIAVTTVVVGLAVWAKVKGHDRVSRVLLRVLSLGMLALGLGILGFAAAMVQAGGTGLLLAMLAAVIAILPLVLGWAFWPATPDPLAGLQYED